MEAQTAEERVGTPVLTEEEVLELIAPMRHRIDEGVLASLKSGNIGTLKVNCVDGRPDEEMSGPYIRRFGGAGGYVLNLIGGLRSIEVPISQHHRRIVVKIVRDFLGKDGFFLHGDTHNEDYHGCGHCFNAVKNHQNYGLEREDSEGLDMLFFGLPKQILLGNHEEVAVLVVHTPELIHKTGPQQFFVLNLFLDDIILENLSSLISRALELDPEKVLSAIKSRRDANMQATLLALKVAEKGIPIFHIY